MKRYEIGKRLYVYIATEDIEVKVIGEINKEDIENGYRCIGKDDKGNEIYVDKDTWEYYELKNL